ncbi:MAG: DUF6151 family protein [Parasphingopyxis sp.]
MSCICGKVRGRLRDVGPGKGDRYVCHCDDCQAFVRRLGRAEEVLDAHAGTSVYQTRVAKLVLDSGVDQLAAIHLTDKATLRWYARCCQTPLFNTMGSGKQPFLSVLTFALDEDRRDETLGPPSGHVFTKFAEGDVGNVPTTATPVMIYRALKRILADRLSGDWKRSPLFDPADGRPVATPERLDGTSGQAPADANMLAHIEKRR